MSRNTLLGFVLLLLAGFSWWLAQTQEKVDLEPSFGNASDIDYYLRDLNAITLQADGQLARTLQAPEAQHLFNSGATHLKQPVLFIHRQNQPPWRIESETGEISPEGDWVFLQGKVTITRAALPPDIRPVQLYTSNVRVRPEQAYAETDESVKVYSNQDWLEATGMRAWLREPISIQLLERVKSFYAPPT